MIEQKYIQTAIDYKKNVAGKFVLVEGAKLKQRIDGERFAVTRKIDGHMQVVFMFKKSYQVQHVNGLTYDFLFDMAKKLAEADSMMLVGGGQKGTDPIVMANGGTPYRAFLEGRVDGDRYALILRLTNMELKSI